MSLTWHYVVPSSGQHTNPQVTGARVQLPLGTKPFVHGAMPTLQPIMPGRRSDATSSLAVRDVDTQMPSSANEGATLISAVRDGTRIL